MLFIDLKMFIKNQKKIFCDIFVSLMIQPRTKIALKTLNFIYSDFSKDPQKYRQEGKEKIKENNC